MARRNTTDANHKEIVAEFKKIGFSVKNLCHVGGSLPDIIVAKHGYNVLVEIKTPGGKVSKGQADFMQAWKGLCRVVRTTEDVIALEQYLFDRKQTDLYAQMCAAGE
jgi:hypothetical protein